MYISLIKYDSMKNLKHKKVKKNFRVDRHFLGNFSVFKKLNIIKNKYYDFNL